ncbi:hypothetical protein V6Z11_A10G214300 [Gossypium hirsutum]|uniref:Uncharacterized protein n=1 Tax=Gossypium darwinii TaxID=34276 RepID=A0A5D2F3K1_GOSDA|nr:hypothetical protein ES288_A10G220000v1 [Gossypium darwinii]TYG99742.1 hypothetical protein ES288_A10G220000v1 [Gossypium darwinii]
MLHIILFGKKAKPHSLKRNIGQFSGYVWVENEQEKQKARVREKIDKYVKEKLVDLCDLLNIPFMRTNEEVTAKLLEFLESPHATTDVLLADQEQVAEQDYEKVKLNKRIAKLSGGVAVIQGVCWKSQFGIQRLSAETGAASIYCGFWF